MGKAIPSGKPGKSDQLCNCLTKTSRQAAPASDPDQLGAVFTRREVVDFILDLVGYSSAQRLHEMTLLEPSFGSGEFLFAAVDRLITAWQQHAAHLPSSALENCIRGVEIDSSSHEVTRSRLVDLLCSRALSISESEHLAKQWLWHGDFLLTAFCGCFDFVVGNPPYVRQERIPPALLRQYKDRYQTIFDRADLYVPFIEQSLNLLSQAGTLGFICANRWTKNRYGGPLRQMIAEKYHLKIHVDIGDTQPFHSHVTAYPAITVITRAKPGPTRIACLRDISKDGLSGLAEALVSAEDGVPRKTVELVSGVADGDSPWILGSRDQLALVRRLERDFPSLEEAGCKVGIGVATGADRHFIAPYDQLDIEEDRKLPLVMTGDIRSGTVRWAGLGLVNPFSDDGDLVDLDCYPCLRRYLESNRNEIARRHIARKTPSKWYRTIDRIHPELSRTPKLLIPDIKGAAHIVYEQGKFYPHHNLYFIVSASWDLRALQAVLLSGIARLFVAAYSTRMRGGYLRHQAQYLRRIHIPHWRGVPADIKDELVAAAATEDRRAQFDATCRLYELSAQERRLLDSQRNQGG